MWASDLDEIYDSDRRYRRQMAGKLTRSVVYLLILGWVWSATNLASRIWKRKNDSTNKCSTKSTAAWPT